jgi:hypothetical protein
LFNVAGAAHTALSASTELTDILFNLAQTKQFATGALTDQRAVRILAPTYGFVGASTLTRATTLYIDRQPQAGANATITNAYALWVDAGVCRFDDTLEFTASAAPTLVEGRFWNDSTRKAKSYYFNALRKQTVGEFWTKQADTTVVNTTVQTTLLDAGIGTKTLPANWFLAGKTLRIRASGYYNTDFATPGQFTFYVYKGSTVLANWTFVPLGSVSGNTWEIDCDIVGRSGTSVYWSHIFKRMQTPTGITYVDGVSGSGSGTIGTTSEAMDLRITMTVATASNSVICTTCSFEEMG